MQDQRSVNTVTPSCILVSSKVLPARENECSEDVLVAGTPGDYVTYVSTHVL